MMPVIVSFIGAVIGLSFGLFIRELVPARPSLATRLQVLNGAIPAQRGARTTPAAKPSLQERIGEFLNVRLSDSQWFKVPTRDLELLQRSRESYWGEKGLLFLLGLGAPMLFVALLAAVGLHLGFVLPAFVCLAAGVLFSYLPDISVKARAVTRRIEYRAVLNPFFVLIALERKIGATPGDALIEAAKQLDGGIVPRVEAALVTGKEAGLDAWESLHKLAEATDLVDLQHLSDILRTAEADAAIYNSLIARSRAMRVAQLTDLAKKANDRSVQMYLPLSMTVILLLVMIVVPMGLGIKS